MGVFSAFFIIAGVAWMWVAGYLALPVEAASFGGIGIGLGTCGVAIAILRERNKYNF